MHDDVGRTGAAPPLKAIQASYVNELTAGSNRPSWLKILEIVCLCSDFQDVLGAKGVTKKDFCRHMRVL